MPFFVKWTGQGGFELSNGEQNILLDPYLSDLVERIEGLKRLAPPPILPADAHPGLYLVTHDLLDHLDADTISAMDTEGVAFAAPGSCVVKLAELGVPNASITRLDRGGHLEFGRIFIEAVYARHTEDSIGLVLGCDGVRPTSPGIRNSTMRWVAACAAMPCLPASTADGATWASPRLSSSQSA